MEHSKDTLTQEQLNTQLAKVSKAQEELDSKIYALKVSKRRLDEQVKVLHTKYANGFSKFKEGELIRKNLKVRYIKWMNGTCMYALCNTDSGNMHKGGKYYREDDLYLKQPV